MMKWQPPSGQEIKECNSELLINYTKATELGRGASGRKGFYRWLVSLKSCLLWEPKAPEI